METRAPFVVVGAFGMVLALHYSRGIGETHPTHRRTSLAASGSPGVIPARHHSQTRSPKWAGTVYRITGRWPCLVWIQAWTQPVRTR